ncbi:hypothetical protein VCR17J2_890064 [Vibrio coralliirubri]|nr:hypothetical protein VCR17J2_890064 [Vibrio coralliirubri]
MTDGTHPNINKYAHMRSENTLIANTDWNRRSSKERERI